MTTVTWLDLPADTHFGVHNLPYGVYTTADQPGRRRIGVAVGDFVLDAAAAARATVLDVDLADLLAAPSLNPLLAAGREVWTRVRAEVTAWLTDPAFRATVEPCLVPRAEVTLHLPFEVGDYVDFYASEHHASNLGRLFRPGSEPLTPNWKHLPIGYHGRSGTVVVSGTPVVRPHGQRKAPTDAVPDHGPSRRLDIEAEVGFVVGAPSELGTPVPLDAFADHVFGVCLVNDWSARDIQAWEYVPLGPFLGKSFATSVSPWIVPLDALTHARTAPPTRDVDLLPYLDDRGDEQPWGLDLAMEVRLNGTVVSRPRVAGHVWAPPAAVRGHVLDRRAAARAHDRERGQRPGRRPVRLRYGQRPGPGDRGRADRAHLER
jgi:fumarylacetoacetase